MKSWFGRKAWALPATLVGASLLLYLIGFKWLFVPVLIGCLARWLPFPRLYDSYLSRFVVGGLLMTSLMLLAVFLQLIFFSGTGFRTLAVLTAILSMILIAYAARHSERPGRWATRKDGAALVLVLLFAVPIVALTGVLQPNISNIARFGSVQSADGVNHFVMLNEMSQKENLDFASGSYYPRGFHLSVAFIQDGMYFNQADQRFGINARLFVLQYLIFGSLFVYIFFYTCRLIVDTLGKRLRGRGDFLLALTAGLPFILFFAWPFVYQGFLNYYFVVTVVLVGLAYLEAARSRAERLGQDIQHWFLLGYLLLAFAAGMSWPLLVPPLLLMALLYLRPSLNPRQWWPWVADRSNWPLLAGFILQFAPIYVQLNYAIINNGEQLNAHGSLRTFHFAAMLLGLAIIMYASLSQRWSEELRRLISNVFQPLYLLLVVLVTTQYFMNGDVRYYAIKVSLLIEIILLALGVAAVVYVFAVAKLSRAARWYMPVLTLFMGCLLLMGMESSPLKDVREMFRRYSGFGTPAFFEPDIMKLTNLASTGGVRDSNVTVMHYDPESDKWYGNMATSNWIMAMQPQPSNNYKAQECSMRLYTLAMYKEVSPGQQKDLKAQLDQCARISRKADNTFYVVTDHGSVPFLRTLYGEAVKIVY